ncbi:Eisosome component PIL1-domain-containing protein [Obelidium mucronatum]|nr:Eisosome component PIL1-domain-containing protein [Obelidium mucronatum]
MFPKQLLRLTEVLPIQSWISDEKDLVKNVKALGKAHSQVAKGLTVWGKPEAEDIKTISCNLAALSGKMEELHLSLAAELENSRAILKEIKAREESLSVTKKKQRDLQAKLDSAIKKSSSGSGAAVSGTTQQRDGTDLIRIDLGALDREVMVAQADFEGFKREAFKKAVKKKWNAVIEFSAKMIVLANFGNHISDQIPQGKLAPGYDLPAFKNAHIISQIMSDYESQSAQWRNFIPTDLNFSLSGSTELNGATSSTGVAAVVSTSLDDDIHHLTPGSSNSMDLHLSPDDADIQQQQNQNQTQQQHPHEQNPVIGFTKQESVKEEIYHAGLAIETSAAAMVSASTTATTIPSRSLQTGLTVSSPLAVSPLLHSPAAPNAFKTISSLEYMSLQHQHQQQQSTPYYNAHVSKTAASAPLFANTSGTTDTQAGDDTEESIFMDAVPVDACLVNPHQPQYNPSIITKPNTPATLAMAANSALASPVQPGGFLYSSRPQQQQQQQQQYSRQIGETGAQQNVDSSVLLAAGLSGGRQRPVSNLAAAVAEAVGPLGRIPVGSSGVDKKGGGASGGPVVATAVGVTGLLGSVGDGVTDMLRAAAVVAQVQQQPQQVSSPGGGGDVRRMSSLALALAEGGEDDKKGVVVAGRNISVGDGVTGMLRELTAVESAHGVAADRQPLQSLSSVNVPAAVPATAISSAVAATAVPANAVKPILGTFVVMFDYEQTPGKADEVSIVVGDLIDTNNVYEDGWGFGRVQRTNAVGFFPFNAVYPALSTNGTRFTAQDIPSSVCGVAVSPSPAVLFNDGVIGQHDFEIITGVLDKLEFAQ